MEVFFGSARGLQSRPWNLDDRCQGGPGSLASDEREMVHWLLTLNSDTIDTKEITRFAKCQEREDSKIRV